MGFCELNDGCFCELNDGCCFCFSLDVDAEFDEDTDDLFCALCTGLRIFPGGMVGGLSGE